ncbi:MAG TPA: sortase [Candidatus Saccharimonadales bacterium]
MSDPTQPSHHSPAPGGQLDQQPAYVQPVTIVTPTQPIARNSSSDPAVELIRNKIHAIYAEEPDAGQEIVKVESLTHQGSPHQQYMAQLNSSGKSMTEIQTAWHNYYAGLPDQEKYKVWQEFYVANGSNPAYQQFTAPTQPLQTIQPTIKDLPTPAKPKPAVVDVSARVTSRAAALDRHTKSAEQAIGKTAGKLKTALTTEHASDIKKRILSSVKSAGSASAGGKLKAEHHLRSLAFGLGAGLFAVFIVLFGFFNELFIAPFVQPSRRINDTPIIVDVASTVVSGGPKIIIPKINLEIPTDYSQTTTDEKQIELALDNGVVHYPTTVKPGQAGNAAFFGHSSNNIFNPGKYKFAFVLLNQLVEGDTFYLTHDGKTYAYRVFSKRIVEPSEVSVLGPVAGKAATATLITCDPPGTSLRRLVVVGEQISPDPAGNAAPEGQTPKPIVAAAAKQSGLPGNGPTLWSRIWNSVF